MIPKYPLFYNSDKVLNFLDFGNIGNFFNIKLSKNAFIAQILLKLSFNLNIRIILN